MIEPCRAVVRPRFIDPETGASMPLEFEIANLVESNERGLIGIIGGRGSGKTTALRHLAALLPEERQVQFMDGPGRQPEVVEPGKGIFIYAAQRALPEYNHLATFYLAPWDIDELIEYVQAHRRDRCASVMKRVMAADDRDFLQGLPALWQVVLDEFEEHEEVAATEAALARALRLRFQDELRTVAQEYSVGELLDIRTKFSAIEGSEAKAQYYRLLKQAKTGEFAEQFSLLRFHPVQLIFAAELLVAEIKKQSDFYVSPTFSEDIVTRVGQAIRDCKPAIDYLNEVLRNTKERKHPMAASILHFADPAWRPDVRKTKMYYGGIFPDAHWPDAILDSANFMRADLTNAQLTRADLRFAKISSANLRGANLSGAQMQSTQSMSTNFTGADLSAVSGASANFAEANCAGARFKSAMLMDAKFAGANLQRASLIVANLAKANLSNAKIAGADFTGAILDNAIMHKLALNSACFARARFEGADLTECDASGMQLDRANFKGAILKDAELTASSFPEGNFAGADLSGARMAEIEWPKANLAGADLRKVTFHMGSTRAGMLFSPIASEGSKTGFYTDEYYEQGFKAPEQIRKANLCGADLRGARIDFVDFYLVDLRDALYDDEQKQWFKKCGAILESRVK